MERKHTRTLLSRRWHQRACSVQGPRIERIHTGTHTHTALGSNWSVRSLSVAFEEWRNNLIEKARETAHERGEWASEHGKRFWGEFSFKPIGATFGNARATHNECRCANICRTQMHANGSVRTQYQQYLPQPNRGKKGWQSSARTRARKGKAGGGYLCTSTASDTGSLTAPDCSGWLDSGGNGCWFVFYFNSLPFIFLFIHYSHPMKQ